MRLIDADALLDDVMKRYCKDCDRRKGIKNGKWRIIYEVGEVPCRACSVDDMKCEIENAPTVDATPVRHGKWIDRNGAIVASFWERYECSECGVMSGNNKYCPNCGARMDKE